MKKTVCTSKIQQIRNYLELEIFALDNYSDSKNRFDRYLVGKILEKVACLYEVKMVVMCSG